MTDRPCTSAAVPPQGLPLDGEVLNGRLMVYADSLALGLIEMADKFDALSPELLLYAGHTPGKVLRDIGAQLAQAVVQYQDIREDDDATE